MRFNINLIIKIFLIFLLVLPRLSPLSGQENYFQQEVNFTINVTLDDQRHLLKASETIQYINNSPDNLDFIYFHLWPNAYSGNNTDLAKQIFRTGGKQKLFNDPRKRGWIDSLNFSVNNIPVNYEELPGQPDICLVRLPEKLPPGDTILITTPFMVKFPEGNISRMGFNNGAYQVSQWYPKPAVYDKNGWHPMPYLDQGEYYSEFGRFDVFITLNHDFVVGASGDLVTGSEIEWLENSASEWRDLSVHTQPGLKKTLHFHGENIHDFAWVADKRFRVVTSKLILPQSGREITIRVMYTPNIQALRWEYAPEYVNRAILRFSEWIGDYPYNTFTAVQTSLAAGSGMEYPGMTIIGDAEDDYSLDEVLAHEICHNWFYSALATDERRYPFMDEGLTTAFEERYMNLYHHGKKMWELYFKNPRTARFLKIDKLPVQSLSEIQWLISARDNLEQPLDLPAGEYTDRNYGDLVYFKAAKGFNYLRAFLGDSIFDSIMRDYYSEWGNRHPAPEDLENVFKHHTAGDLSWFFDDFISETKRYDYKLTRLRGDSLLVKNKGEMNSPVSVSGLKDDSAAFTAWHEGFSGKKWIGIPDNNFDEIKLNASHIVPELSYTNNNIKTSGLFRKSDPMTPQLMVSVEDPERRTWMLIPLLNWNRADGFMAGMALNNGAMLPKPVEYVIMPFYTFRDPGLSGKGRVSLNFIPYNCIIRKLTVSLEGAHFGATQFNDYQTIRPGLDIWFRNRNMISTESQRVFWRFISATDIEEIDTDVDAGTREFLQFGYSFERSSMVNPFDLVAALETGDSYCKASLEFNYRISYNTGNRGVDARLFAGAMIKTNPGSPLYSFAPSGRSGRELYLYQGDFPDRFSGFSENFWSRQMELSEGAIVSHVNDTTGYSSSILSFSLSGNLPGVAGRIPVKPFANLVYAADVAKPVFFETGIKAGIWGFLEVHLPLLVTENISSVRSKIKERIRFTLNLNQVLKFRM